MFSLLLVASKLVNNKFLTDFFSSPLLFQVAAEERVRLTWHQPPKATDCSQALSCPHPIAVTGWFEYGSQLDTKVIFPKFAFRPTFALNKNLALAPQYIQLLAIVRVVEPKEIDRSLFPFARLDRSCYIETHHGEEFLFEAASKADRDLFANRLKVLVARLASSVISHDEAMLREFFSSSSY